VVLITPMPGKRGSKTPFQLASFEKEVLERHSITKIPLFMTINCQILLFH